MPKIPTLALQPGDPAPAFTATATDGSVITLAALKGSPVVVYFYPRDDTPGCTKEACAFRDQKKPLDKAGAVVLGMGVGNPNGEG